MKANGMAANGMARDVHSNGVMTPERGHKMAREERRGGRGRQDAAQARGGRRAVLGRLGAVALAVAVVFAAAPAARGALIALTDGTSTVGINPESSMGVYEWNIGSNTYLNQQWFWFRNDLDDYDDHEYSIDELSAPVVINPIPNLAIVNYTDSQNRFGIQVTYLLTGGTGTETSDLAETIRITNLSDDPMTFTFFQYSDFDLAGDPDDHKVAVTGGNTVIQSDYGTTVKLLETVVTGAPDLCETGIGPATLAKLTDLLVDDLDGSAVQNGPANLTWAFQWDDQTIAPGEDFIISKDKLLTTATVPVPEPAGLGLIGIALLGWRKRRS